MNTFTKISTFDTKHEGMIVFYSKKKLFANEILQHDAQYDYYGKKLATCSADGIFYNNLQIIFNRRISQAIFKFLMFQRQIQEKVKTLQNSVYLKRILHDSLKKNKNKNQSQWTYLAISMGSSKVRKHISFMLI